MSDVEKYAEYQRLQREAEKERARIEALIHRSIFEMHDLHTCDCEGCKFYWTATTTIHNGQLFEVFPNIKVLIARKGVQSQHLLHSLHMQKVLALRDTKKPIQPLWIVYPHNKGMVYNQL